MEENEIASSNPQGIVSSSSGLVEMIIVGGFRLALRLHRITLHGVFPFKFFRPAINVIYVNGMVEILAGSEVDIWLQINSSRLDESGNLMYNGTTRWKSTLK